MYAIILATFLLHGCFGTPSIDSEKEAVAKAEAEFLKHYGEAILKERPFSAKLESIGWRVSGKVRCNIKNECTNSPAEAIINPNNGEIVMITNGNETTVIKKKKE